MYDYSKLRGRIVEKYGTLSNFAEALGITLVVVSQKMNNKSGFSRADIEKWSNLLDISSSEYDVYFFAHKV
jgi:transcriptional regulator with XRE-family HTH domain